MLDALVNSQHQVISVLGLHPLLILEGHIRTHCVFGGDQPPGCAAELRIILVFQAGKAGIIRAYKAQHRAHKVAIGVIALVIRNELHAAADVVLLQKGQNFVLDVVLHLALDIGEIGILIRQLLHLGFLHVQNLRQAANQGGLILFFYVSRFQGHRPDTGALGQHFAVAVIDGAPLRAEGGGLQALVDGGALQLFPIH